MSDALADLMVIARKAAAWDYAEAWLRQMYEQPCRGRPAAGPLGTAVCLVHVAEWPIQEGRCEGAAALWQAINERGQP